MIFSGDGGSSADYRLSFDQTELEIESGQYNRGLQSNNSSDPSLRAAFPGIFVDLATQHQQGTTDTVTPAGSSGFQWMTLISMSTLSLAAMGFTACSTILVGQVHPYQLGVGLDTGDRRNRCKSIQHTNRF